ncbi:MAG: 4Fe-4S dicluster domain-containing protein [bacterium]
MCSLVCTLTHEGVTGLEQARIKIARNYPSLMDPLFKAAFCQNCANAECIAACAVGALVEDAEGIVRLDPETCIGCGTCVEACPFHAIWMDAKTEKAFKCDLCGGKPECVGYCLHDALKFE